MNYKQDLVGLQRREVLRPSGMLDLKGGRQSLKKIYILYTSYAASEGVGVFHPASSWDCRPLAGSPLQVLPCRFPLESSPLQVHRLGRQYMLEPVIIFC